MARPIQTNTDIQNSSDLVAFLQRLCRISNTRAYIIVSHDFISECLRRILEKKLSDPSIALSNRKRKSIFRTFKNRLDASKSCNIITADQFTIINELNKIRNEFAHNFKLINVMTADRGLKRKMEVFKKNIFPKNERLLHQYANEFFGKKGTKSVNALYKALTFVICIEIIGLLLHQHQQELFKDVLKLPKFMHGPKLQFDVLHKQRTSNAQ